MKTPWPSPIVILIGLMTLAACDRNTTVTTVSPPESVARTTTFETGRLGKAVDAYERTPSAENATDVKKALSELDGEIAELEALVAKRTGSDRNEAATKLKNLREYRAAEFARFTTAQAKKPLSRTNETDGRSGGEKVENTAQKVGDSIEKAAKDVGTTLKDAVR